ncbi:MAG: hypothetical protein IJO29_03675 [Oscillospiraceae bacterium]|nr:hypothetical protein [Oscillospiraceae bacterium]
MKRLFKRFFSLMISALIAVSMLCIPNAVAVNLPVDYASAVAVMEETNYIIDGSSVYLFVDYEVGTGQSWTYLRRMSADVSYVSNTVFTESGQNYVGDKAVAMFRFDAASAGIFRVAVYLNQGGVIASDPVCFNFVVTGNDTDGYVFSDRFPQSDMIPMDYYEAEQIDGFVVDGDLMIICFESDENEWNVSVSSSFTWEVDTNIGVPIQSVAEYALNEETAGYVVIALKITSAGDGKVLLTSADGTQKIEYPVSAALSDDGTVIITDERIKYGDVNGDGVVNSIDATIVCRAALNVYSLSEDQTVVADVNCDGVINSIDATIITRYSLKVLTALPVDNS